MALPGATDEATIEPRNGVLWALGALATVAVLALVWFTVIGTTRSVEATASSTCHGAIVSSSELGLLPRFAPVASITTQEWGVVRVNRRLFRPTRYTFASPTQRPVELHREDPGLMGYSCAG